MVAVAACNALTGAGDVTFDDDGGGAGGGSSGAFSSSVGNQPQMRAVDGVSISAITLNQGMRRPLMEGGAPAVTDVPVVAGRQGLLRVYYTADPGNYNGEPVTAQLIINDGEPLQQVVSLNGMSVEGALATTINFEVPGELLEAGSTYRVDLLQPKDMASGANAAAGYPAEGSASFEAQSGGSAVKVVLVPIAYNGDGSGRLPDTSPEQVQLYRDGFYKIYPAPAAEVTVLDPYPWSSTVSPFGQGWGELLQAITNFRSQNGAAPDEYYYGIFRGTESFGQWCNGGCILGLAGLAGPTDEWSRAGIGIGFSGQGSVETSVHEVGHQHGREHAPCGANNSVDPQFPYADGSIGDWGYDIVQGTLVPPGTADFMSYCDPTWVSDYTYKALFQRIKFVNGADIAKPASMPPHYERISIGLDGVASWQAPVHLRFPPAAEPVQITLQSAAGKQQVTGQLYRYTHLSGGYLLFPPGSLGTAGAASFVVDGQPHHVVR